MLELIKVILITFIWVMGIKISTSEGMVFEKLGKYAERKVEKGYKIWEALIACEWCLPSVHSVFGYAFSFGIGIIPFEFQWKYIIMLPIVIMGTSFLSGNVWNIYLTINKIKENNEAQAAYFKYIIDPKNHSDGES